MSGWSVAVVDYRLCSEVYQGVEGDFDMASSPLAACGIFPSTAPRTSNSIEPPLPRAYLVHTEGSDL